MRSPTPASRCARSTRPTTSAVGGIAIEVASSRPSADGADDPDAGTVLVEEFESADDRDGHVRDVYLHGRLRPFTTATPFGRYTVRLAGGSAARS